MATEFPTWHFRQPSDYAVITQTIQSNRLIEETHVPVTQQQAVWIEYKRRWIFWKRVKAVHLTLSSDNPYVQIEYSEYIAIQ